MRSALEWPKLLLPGDAASNLWIPGNAHLGLSARQSVPATPTKLCTPHSADQSIHGTAQCPATWRERTGATPARTPRLDGREPAASRTDVNRSPLPADGSDRRLP